MLKAIEISLYKYLAKTKANLLYLYNIHNVVSPLMLSIVPTYIIIVYASGKWALAISINNNKLLY